MAMPVYTAELLGIVLLFFLVFGMSATVDLNHMLKQLRNKRALATGVFLQFVILPFLGFLSVKMMGLNEAMGMTLLVVTSSPGGSFSNWWCSIFNADLALSVTMTAISTLLAIVMLPLNLYLYTPMAFNDDQIDVFAVLDFSALVTSLIVVVSAVCLGIFVSEKVEHPGFHIYANRFGSFAGVSLVLLSGIVSNATDGDGIWEREPKFYIGVAMPCIVALVLSTVMTTYLELKKPERVTSSIECCYQNCGIATSVALSMFNGEERALALGVPFFYGVVEFLAIGVYSIWAWKAGWTKAPPSEPFWKVITCSYEVLLAEKERGNAEVQLAGYDDCGVEVTGDYRKESNNDGGALAILTKILYYCHEPDLAKVDPAPSKVDQAVEKPETDKVKVEAEKEEVKEDLEKQDVDAIDDSYVILNESDDSKQDAPKQTIILGGSDDPKQTTRSLRFLFWTSQGYDIPQE